MAKAALTDEQILSKAQLTALNRALASVDRALDIIDRAEPCIGDCADERQAVEDVRQELIRIKAEFFPGST
jgi:hypothetical protein